VREDDPSPRIQDEGHRNSGASEVMQQVAPVVDDLRVVHSDCGEEALGAVRIVLGVDADEAHLPTVPGVRTLQGRHLLLAGHTPRRPQVHQDRGAAEAGRVHRRPGAQALKREPGQPGITARPGTANPGVRGAGSEPTALPVLVREVGMTHDVTMAAAATSNATSNGPLRNPLTPLAPRTALYDVS